MQSRDEKKHFNQQPMMTKWRWKWKWEDEQNF